jgi:hypothetical protein
MLKLGAAPKPKPQVPKAPTGIQGLDEITNGGLPDPFTPGDKQY